jgi:perosamine synthetase
MNPRDRCARPAINVRRTLPPAAAEMTAGALLRAAAGLVARKRYLARLESELRHHFDVRHVFLTSSGKCALTIILRALSDLSGRRQVVVPAYTCFSVPAAVIRASLHVRVCDIDPATLDFDYGCLARTITPQTLCVVPTHLFGLPADVTSVARLCRRQGTFVVEDAAQAIGIRDRGTLLGTMGDVGFFSLGRGKTITGGSGGIIVTNSGRIAGAITRHYAALPHPTFAETLRDFLRLLLMRVFLHPGLFWIPRSMPWLRLGQTIYDAEFPIARLSGVNAGALHGWRDRLWRTLRDRRATAEYFGAALGLPPAHRTPGSPVRLPVVMESREARDRLYAISEQRGLGLGIMYPTAINAIEDLRAMVGGQQAPGAELVAERLLTIPTHHLVSEADKRALCELLRPARGQAVAA